MQSEITQKEMDLDQGNVPPPENPKPARALWLVWMLLGILPVPIGLLIGPIKLFNSAQGSNHSLFVRYAVLTAVFSVIGGIGLCGGFTSREIGNRVVGVLGGIILGFAITGINLSAVFFVGCAAGLSGI